MQNHLLKVANVYFNLHNVISITEHLYQQKYISLISI